MLEAMGREKDARLRGIFESRGEVEVEVEELEKLEEVEVVEEMEGW